MKHFLLLIFTLSSLLINAQTFTRTELNTSLNNPWEIVYGPDDFLYLTEKEGIVSRVDATTGDRTIIYSASDYFGGSDLEETDLCPNLGIGIGTFGLALHPDFSSASTSFIYFVYSYNSGTEDEPATKFRIKRLTWDAITNSVVSDTNIVNLISTGYDHLGGRLMAIEQNNNPYLILTVGDNGRADQNGTSCYTPPSSNPNLMAQDVNTQNGKIHRFNMDGTIPEDNPIAGNSFYTRGHRNPQGLMYNADLEILYNVEHGDRTDDEINLLHKGMNYGWINIHGYSNDNSYEGEADYEANYTPNPLIENDALIEPLYSWCTTLDTTSVWTDWCTVAPSDGIYYSNDGIPEWNNSLLVVTLKDGLTTDRQVFQFKLEEDGSIASSTNENPNPKKYFGEDQEFNGRLRDIAISPNGEKIYLINNGGTDSDKITVYTYNANGVGFPEINAQLQLYPNPVSSELFIKGIQSTSNIIDAKISSILGQSYSVKIDPNQNIDVSDLSNGIYFIQFTYQSKNRLLKFIKI